MLTWQKKIIMKHWVSQKVRLKLRYKKAYRSKAKNFIQIETLQGQTMEEDFKAVNEAYET